MDRTAKLCGELERGNDGTTLPPPKHEEPDPFTPPSSDSPLLFHGGPRSPDPPPPDEPTNTSVTSVQAAQAARLHFVHDGLVNRPYHPQFGGGTGVRGGSSVPTRWCLDRNETVEVTACENCKWGDYLGSQMEECLFVLEEKQRAKEGQEDESEE
jgi:hypothetical protein